MRSEVVTAKYEPCPDCRDGSCRKCGPASNDHAAPGVRFVLRRVRFIRCGCPDGCIRCAGTHVLAAPGVRVEIVEERSTKQWVPVIHFHNAFSEVGAAEHGSARCGVDVEEKRLTARWESVTCERCLRYRK